MSERIPVYGVENSEKELIVIEAPQNYLSFYDLEGVVGFMSCKENQDKVELERILWENGADISKPYSLSYVLHRPRTSNIPYHGFRVDYSERTDKEWLLSGAASEEAKLHTLDIHMQIELLRLDPRNAVHKKRGVDEDVECSVDISNIEGDCV